MPRRARIEDKLERMTEILEAIKFQFDDGATQVYAHGLLFDDDDTLQTHIEEVLK